MRFRSFFNIPYSIWLVQKQISLLVKESKDKINRKDNKIDTKKNHPNLTFCPA
jgi:hypothetical protein